jgi:7-carboxy-7-deazaguanine synthase
MSHTKLQGKISEVFESVQGEGIYLGERQIFVRLYGCNLECSYCDTKIDTYREYTPQELFDEITLHGGEFHSVSFTGGEPLMQVEFLRSVMELTRKAGYKNYLETNGTLAQEFTQVKGVTDVVAMDFKLPSSTGLRDFWQEHKYFLQACKDKDVFIKMVVRTATSETDVRAALAAIKEVCGSAIVVLQPDSNDRSGQMQQRVERLRDVCTEAQVAACIIPQMHKLVGLR